MVTGAGAVPGPHADPPARSSSYRIDKTAMGQGRQLFTCMNCAGCHGDHGGSGMGPRRRDVDWIYRVTDPQVLSSIAEGRGHGMPSRGVKLNDDDIWKLVAPSSRSARGTKSSLRAGNQDWGY